MTRTSRFVLAVVVVAFLAASASVAYAADAQWPRTYSTVSEAIMVRWAESPATQESRWMSAAAVSDRYLGWAPDAHAPTVLGGQPLTGNVNAGGSRYETIDGEPGIAYWAVSYATQDESQVSLDTHLKHARIVGTGLARYEEYALSLDGVRYLREPTSADVPVSVDVRIHATRQRIYEPASWSGWIGDMWVSRASLKQGWFATADAVMIGPDGTDYADVTRDDWTLTLEYAQLTKDVERETASPTVRNDCE
jgi:hypothetical protein